MIIDDQRIDKFEELWKEANYEFYLVQSDRDKLK